jgi:hypothetical protein
MAFHRRANSTLASINSWIEENPNNSEVMDRRERMLKRSSSAQSYRSPYRSSEATIASAKERVANLKASTTSPGNKSSEFKATALMNSIHGVQKESLNVGNSRRYEALLRKQKK